MIRYRRNLCIRNSFSKEIGLCFIQPYLTDDSLPVGYIQVLYMRSCQFWGVSWVAKVDEWNVDVNKTEGFS